jgi:hypothetical protein
MHAGSKPSRYVVFALLVVSALGILAVERAEMPAPGLAVFHSDAGAKPKSSFTATPQARQIRHEDPGHAGLQLISVSDPVD